MKNKTNENADTKSIPFRKYKFLFGIQRPRTTECNLYGQSFQLVMKYGNLFKESTFHLNKFSSSYSGYLAYDDATAVKQINLVRDNELYMGSQLEVDNATRNYVKKGTLGSCWLFLSPRFQIFEIHVVPNDQKLDKEYAGIFYFRIWQYGRWWRGCWISSFQLWRRSSVYKE